MRDRVGEKFGRLTVIKLHEIKKFDCGASVSQWLCRCKCGNTTVVSGSNLTGTNAVTACGCQRGETHHSSDTQEYSSWSHMKRRCYDKNAHNYQYYGAKGVTVHKAWRKSFLAFLEYMGKAPSSQHTLDRYPNPLGNYEPGNVRWATKSAQTAERNRRYKK